MRPVSGVSREGTREWDVRALPEVTSAEATREPPGAVVCANARLAHPPGVRQALGSDVGPFECDATQFPLSPLPFSPCPPASSSA